MNILKRFYFQLLLLQLEEYEILRYLKTIKNTQGKHVVDKVRKPLVFTFKIKLVLSLSIILFLVFQVLININIHNIPALFLFSIILILSFIFYPFIFFTIVVGILSPIDFVIKNIVIFLAKQKIKRFPNLKIIGIAGSYGKTGMKEFIYLFLSQKFEVLKTDKSINTPYAISSLILKSLNDKTEILIIEMGEYYQGDIKKLCKITPPNISIITGINEAHLERLKTIKNTINTIFEIVAFMKKDGYVLLNNQDKNIKENYLKYIKNKKHYLYQNNNKFEFDENLPGYILNYHKNKFYLPVLGSYNLDKIDACMYLTYEFKLNTIQVQHALRSIKPIPHRLEPIYDRNQNILIIDDSYNGNPAGVSEAIKTLSLFKNKRKIYVTPGLVEMGEKSKVIHEQIGKSLSSVADLVILIKNSVTPFIEKGLLENGFSDKKIVYYENGNTAYSDIKNIIKSGDVILLQNDWPDNYV